MNYKMYHTPEGVRDITPDSLKKKLDAKKAIIDTIEKDGYCLIETPSFEYFDVFANKSGQTPSNELFKFYDKEGNTLVLRPDFTPSMARAFSKHYYNETAPVKLCYSGNTFVNSGDLNGRLKESTQIGAECYNDDSVNADAEIISLMIRCMEASGFNNFVISLGNVEFFKGLFGEYGINETAERELRELISVKNYFAARAFLENISIDEDIKELIVNISEQYSGYDSLKSLLDKVKNERSRDAVKRLLEIYDILKNQELSKYISFDLGLLNQYDYYTGVCYRAYTFGYGDAVMKGGRYDRLVKDFGKDTPAIGFGICLDELMIAKSNLKGNDDIPLEDRYITFALTKGRLANDTLGLLEKIGITCEEMKDKNSRKLIFVNEELKLKFFLSKGPDVPTYVEHGVADIGVVGKDTIDEENRTIFEVLDLGFGKCKMCVCGYESAKELLNTRDRIRVATKYPLIARKYFTEVKHKSVDIIKLNGSIELAPIVGLSDVIVDIVETGSTLKENGLKVLEEVCPLSARVVVNPVSMRVLEKRINELIRKIREEL